MNWKMLAIKASIENNDIAVTDRLARKLLGLDEDIDDGGPGSGNYGHRGRPGKHGGSLPQGESQAVTKEESKKGFATSAAESFANSELQRMKVGEKFDVRRNKGVVSTFEKTKTGWHVTRKNEKTGKVYEDREMSNEEMANTLFTKSHEERERAKQNKQEETREPESVNEPEKSEPFDPDDLENELEREDLYEDDPEIPWNMAPLREKPNAEKPKVDGPKLRSYLDHYLSHRSSDKDFAADGGPGSGNFGHKGRPGQVGGSGKGGSGANIKLQYVNSGTKESLPEYEKRMKAMKESTPKTVPQSKHKSVTGKDMTSTYKKSDPYIEREFDQYVDTEIEDILVKQGFNGVPKVVSKKEFDKQLKDNPDFPVMFRTFSAPNEEVLKQYSSDLEKGAWYVDCGIGGSKYGQGMYTAYAPKRQIADIKDIRFHLGGYESEKYDREIDLDEQVDNTVVKVGDDYFISDTKRPFSLAEFENGEYIMAMSTYSQGRPTIYRVDSTSGRINEGDFRMRVTDVEDGEEYREYDIDSTIFRMRKVSKEEAEARNISRPMGQMQMYIHHNESRDKRHFGKQDEYDKKIRELSMKDGTDLMYATVHNDQVPDIVEVDREEVNSAGRNEGFYKVDKNGEKLTDEKFNSLAPGDYLVTYYSRWDDPTDRDMRVIHVDENGEMKHLHEWEFGEVKEDYEKWKDRNPMIYKCEDVTPEPPEPVVPVSMTRRMTLDPSAKVIRYRDLEKEFNSYDYEHDIFRSEEKAMDELRKEEGLTVGEADEILHLSKLKRNMYIGSRNLEEYNKGAEKFGYKRTEELIDNLRKKVEKIHVPSVEDIGAYAALKGYDAVVCDNYGMTLVVYNRTKLIIDEESVEVPRREAS